MELYHRQRDNNLGAENLLITVFLFIVVACFLEGRFDKDCYPMPTTIIVLIRVVF